MRILLGLIIALIVVPMAAVAQPKLNGFIGLDTPPADEEIVCTNQKINIKYPWDLNAYPQWMAFPNPTINDFRFYTNDTVGVTASKLLATGKPLVLIDGSYTCDVFRYAIPQINQLYQRYGDSISMYVVYTLEAHPIVDTNFYKSNQSWVVKNDSIDNVLYRQPKTYGERRAMVDTMMRRQTSPTLLPPIIIDGPCNQWWNFFGPAPNCAYLIASDGHVVKHQPWFNVKWTTGVQQPQPDFLSHYIDSILHPLGSKSVARSETSSSPLLWPNPVSIGSSLHISIEAPSRITFFDMLGRPVMSKEVNEEIQIEGIAPGSYFYRLEGTTPKTGRLIITP
jgi:hypothetical protein